jgi:hypothetical protein
MQINFFEEYPIEQNLNLLSKLDFKSTIYLAAKSFEEFKQYQRQVKEINPSIKAGYWPILSQSYWVSPFSVTTELNNLYSELNVNKRDETLEVILDLELPILKKELFLTNLMSFNKNKNIIQNLFHNQQFLNIEIKTAQYPMPSFLTELLGVEYSNENFPHKVVPMYYSSMIQNEKLKKIIQNNIKTKAKNLGSNLEIGLGTIAKGVFGNEPKLSPCKLEEDLDFAKNCGIETATIFRLGGLTSDYLRIIKQFVH